MKKKQQNKSMETIELENYMNNYYGTEHYYTSPVIRYMYTDGVQAFALKAGAYWFLQELNKFTDGDDFREIILSVKNGKADILVDGKKKRHIPFTDCPEGEWKFFYMNNVLMWCNEY